MLFIAIAGAVVALSAVGRVGHASKYPIITANGFMGHLDGNPARALADKLVGKGFPGTVISPFLKVDGKAAATGPFTHQVKTISDAILKSTKPSKKKAIVIGYSLGSKIAMTAVRDNKKVAKNVAGVIGLAPAIGLIERYLKTLPNRTKKPLDEFPGESLAEKLKSLEVELLARANKTARIDAKGGKALYAYAAENRLMRDLAEYGEEKLDVPPPGMLVIYGSQDEVIPSERVAAFVEKHNLEGHKLNVNHGFQVQYDLKKYPEYEGYFPNETGTTEVWSQIADIAEKYLGARLR